MQSCEFAHLLPVNHPTVKVNVTSTTSPSFLFLNFFFKFGIKNTNTRPNLLTGFECTMP